MKSSNRGLEIVTSKDKEKKVAVVLMEMDIYNQGITVWPISWLL